jgi:ABC-2 type transport system ATP-binding protein
VPETTPVIVAEGLTRCFSNPHDSTTITAVDNLFLEVRRGEVFGFLGHNGAGKTTTVRLLNGVLLPDEGTARVLGLDPVAQGPALRCRTGVLTETPALDERLTGRQNLLVYADLYGVERTEVPCRVADLLETFGLSERADEKAAAYSKGMKHRLALARALLHEPELLFLDEPTAGLDPVAARQVHDLITGLSHEARSVFICTHNLAEAQKLCSRVAVLEHGRLVAIGTPQDLAYQLGCRQRLEIELAPQGLTAAAAILDRVPALTVEDIPPAPTAARKSGDGPAEPPQVIQIAVTGDGREAIADLITALATAGVRIYRVSPHEPSLEDVYFALHDRNTTRSEESPQ